MPHTHGVSQPSVATLYIVLFARARANSVSLFIKSTELALEECCVLVELARTCTACMHTERTDARAGVSVCTTSALLVLRADW